MATATVAYPRGSLYGMVVGRMPPRWLPDAGRAAGLVAAVFAYFGVRGLTGRDPAVAVENARRLMSVERFLHIDVERRLQHLVVGHDTTTHVLNRIYIFGHWPVIAATLLWLLIRHRDVFLRVRNAMLLSGAVALVAFATFPVAPPRLAEPGLVDTVTLQSSAYRVLQPPAFTNQYAAMPSLHVGWNLLVTVAILAVTSRVWLRVAAVALALAMDAAVVLTANHYVVDGIVGAALAALAWRLVARPRRATAHRPVGYALPGRVERPWPVRRWLSRTAVAAVLVLFAVELAVGWPSLAAALARLRAPQPGWLAAGLVLEIAAMGAYALMQRRLLRSAGVHAPLRRHMALAYAAHSLSVTLPGGAAFSTRLNYRQMRRFGASAAVASWAIALSGILSAAAFAVVSTAGAVVANGTPQWRTLAALVLAGLLLVLGVHWITARPGLVEPAARAGLARVNRLLRRPREQGLDQIRGFAEQLRAARLAPGHGTAAAAFAVLNWLLDAAALWMCLRAVGDAPPVGSQVLLAFCAAMATGSITILPGGLGIVDSALIVALVAGGAASATAIAAVVLYRILTLGFIVGAGWLAWLAVTAEGRSEPAAATRS